jgi:transposase
MAKRTRKNFTKDFKDNAVRLMVDGKERISDLSERLGVSAGVLGRWKREAASAGDDRFPGKGHQTALEEENSRLRKELAKLQEERAILKKAVTFFARETK